MEDGSERARESFNSWDGGKPGSETMEDKLKSLVSENGKSGEIDNPLNMEVKVDVDVMASFKESGEFLEDGAPGESSPESMLDSLLLLFNMGSSTKPIVHGVCPLHDVDRSSLAGEHSEELESVAILALSSIRGFS
jgi:hypothetical protein